MTHQLTTDQAVTTITQGEPARQHPDSAALDTVVAAAREALQTTMPGVYTPELADEIAARFTAALTRRTGQPTVCPVYRDCLITEPGHYDHSGHGLKVLDDTDGSTVLDAGMVALSGKDRHAIVYVRNAEFTDAASVRAKTAELRRFLDEVDAMADRVFTDHQARG